MYKYQVVIAAGGIGKRVSSSKPKQLMLIDNKPMIQWGLQEALSIKPERIYILCNNKYPEIAKTVKKLIRELYQGESTAFHVINVSEKTELRENILSNVSTVLPTGVILASEIYQTQQPILETLNLCFQRFKKNICGIYSTNAELANKLVEIDDKINFQQNDYYNSKKRFIQGRYWFTRDFLITHLEMSFDSYINKCVKGKKIYGYSNQFLPISIRTKKDYEQYRNE